MNREEQLEKLVISHVSLPMKGLPKPNQLSRAEYWTFDSNKNEYYWGTGTHSPYTLDQINDFVDRKQLIPIKHISWKPYISVWQNDAGNYISAKLKKSKFFRETIQQLETL